MDQLLTQLSQFSTEITQDPTLFSIATVIAILSACITMALLIDWFLYELKVPTVKKTRPAEPARWLEPSGNWRTDPCKPMPGLSFSEFKAQNRALEEKHFRQRSGKAPPVSRQAGSGVETPASRDNWQKPDASAFKPGDPEADFPTQTAFIQSIEQQTIDAVKAEFADLPPVKVDIEIQTEVSRSAVPSWEKQRGSVKIELALIALLSIVSTAFIFFGLYRIAQLLHGMGVW